MSNSLRRQFFYTELRSFIANQFTDDIYVCNLIGNLEHFLDDPKNFRLCLELSQIAKAVDGYFPEFEELMGFAIVSR